MSTNILYTGDNLFFLRGMNSNTVDLIYLDPPFNSKTFYSAPIGSKAAGATFEDMWTWDDVDKYFLEQLIDDYPYLVQFIDSVDVINGEAMMSYVTYMAQRIIEMHRVLKESGSFYLHCDSTASHYLKIICDRIFGKKNFRNEIIWERIKGAGKKSQHSPKKWGASTDTILFYTKSNDFKLKPYRKYDKFELLEKFPKTDENGDRYYDDSAHIFRSKSLGARPNLCYTWKNFKNPNPSGWTLSKKRLQEEFEKGNFVITETLAGPKLERRKYQKDHPGHSLNNFWEDIEAVGGDEDTGYPTQKPLKLLNRIIEASSEEGDLVLDPFCGCATTLVSAQRLGRKWIGIDVEEKSAELVMERLQEEGKLFDKFIHSNNFPRRTDVEDIDIDDKNIKERLYADQKKKCNGCKDNLDIRHFEIDHIIPRNKNGGDYYENLQLLCANCNRIKGNRPMEYLLMRINERDKLFTKKIGFSKRAD